MNRGFLLLLVTFIGTSQAAKRTHQITVDDYFTQAYIASCAVSPDGKRAAYTEWRWEDKSAGRSGELWTVTIPSGKIQRLTFEKGGKSSPQWSPDSKTIYFAGSFKREGEKAAPYDGSTQVWRINVDGTQPTPITKAKKPIDSPHGNAALVFGTAYVGSKRQPFDVYRRGDDEILEIHRLLVKKASAGHDKVVFRPHPGGIWKKVEASDFHDLCEIDRSADWKHGLPDFRSFYFENCGSAWADLMLSKADTQEVFAVLNPFRTIHPEMLPTIANNVFFE